MNCSFAPATATEADIMIGSRNQQGLLPWRLRRIFAFFCAVTHLASHNIHHRWLAQDECQEAVQCAAEQRTRETPAHAAMTGDSGAKFWSSVNSARTPADNLLLAALPAAARQRLLGD